jgi:hypothetical protein
MSLPLAEEANFNELIELARRRFDTNLLKVEAQVIEHSVRATDFWVPDEPSAKPEIRPEFLRWLSTDAEAAALIDPKGIRVRAATIPGTLNLQSCQISHQMFFQACEFHGQICLMHTRMRSLYLISCEASKGIEADGLRVDGVVVARNFEVCGPISMVGARIEGTLQLFGTTMRGADALLILDSAKIGGSVFLHDGFHCSGLVRMLNAEIDGDLGCIGAKIASTDLALMLDKVRVKGLVSLSEGFQAVGKVSLSGAQVQGDVSFTGASLSGADTAVDLATASIQGHVRFDKGFTSSGRISFHSTRVDNSVDFSGATINATGFAINFEKSSIRGNVFFCDSFKSSGSIGFPGAHLCGDLVVDQASLSALYCLNMNLDGELVWTNIQDPAQTSLWLNGASVRNLRDDRESWPNSGGLHVGGFTYGNATLHKSKTEKDYERNSHAPEFGLKAKDRIEWLNLQPDNEKAQAQPWLQLAALLRMSGDNRSAKRAIFEMRRHQAARNRFPLRWWKRNIYARLQREPLWIVASIALFTFIGFSIFYAAGRDQAMAPTSTNYYSHVLDSKSTAYPTFSPFIYSLENSLPLVKLGQNESWAPNPRHTGSCWFTRYRFLAWSRWLLILLGWGQATVFASALASRVKD